MLTLLKAQESPHARLICFPHAGGSSTAFRAWELPEHMELWAVQPPGRGPRFAEPEIESLEALCEAIVDALRPTLDEGVPYCFFGHSFGCVVAVEVSHRLAERGLRAPRRTVAPCHR